MGAVGKIFETEQVGSTLVLVPQENLSELHLLRFDDATRQVIEQLQAHQVQHIVLDFGQTTYCGSMALGFFVKLWKHVRSVNGQMLLCQLSDHEREVLRLTRLDGLWTICETRDEALAQIDQPPPEEGAGDGAPI